MGFFNKLFNSNKDNGEKKDKLLTNNKLIRLLDAWGRQESVYSYQAVVHELFDGKSFLLVPVSDSGAEKPEPTSIIEFENGKMIYTFSDEEALKIWAKETETSYITMGTQEVIALCEEHEVTRLVVNKDNKNTFVFDLVREEPEQEALTIGRPPSPLSESIVSRINTSFSEMEEIEEAYQFIRTEGDDSVFMIGVRLKSQPEETKDTEDDEKYDTLRTAIIDIVKKSLQSDKPKMPMGIMLLDDDWLGTLINARIPAFYSKLELDDEQGIVI